MAYQSIVSMATVALIFRVLIAVPSRAQPIGVVYGTQENNLPPPNEVVDMYRSNNVQAMRLYDPNQAILEALRGSNSQLLLDVPNIDLQTLASSPSATNDWVQNNVKAYCPDVSFRYVAVGNQANREIKLSMCSLPCKISTLLCRWQAWQTKSKSLLQLAPGMMSSSMLGKTVVKKDNTIGSFSFFVQLNRILQ